MKIIKTKIVEKEDLNSVFAIYRVEGRTRTQILKYKGFMAAYKEARALAHKLTHDVQSILAYDKSVKFVVVEEKGL